MFKISWLTSLMVLSAWLLLPAQEEQSDDDLAREASKQKAETEKINRMAADSHYRSALKFYSGHISADKKDPLKMDLQKARENLVNALSYLSDHKKARELLTKVNSALGIEEDKTDDLLKRQKNLKTAFDNQQEIEIKLAIDGAQKLLKNKDFDEAKKKLKATLDAIAFLPYDSNATAYKEQIRLLLIENKGLQRAEQDVRKVEENDRAESEANRAMKKSLYVHKVRIKDLTIQADDRYDSHDFKRAIALYKIILKLSPEHVHARKMLLLADTRIDQESMRKAKHHYFVDNETRKLYDAEGYVLLDPNLGVKFPNDFMDVARKRQIVNRRRRSSSEADWKTRLRGILDKPATQPYDEQPLEQLLHKLMITFEVLIELDSEIDREMLMDEIPVVNLSFEQVLEILVSKIEGDNLGWTLKYGTIFIGNKDAFSTDTELVNYDVRDLIATINDYAGPQITMVQADSGGAQIEILEPEEDPPSGDDLVELITNTTGEEAWGDNNNIEYRNGSLVVNNSADVQEKIEEILLGMRSQRSLQVTIQARFMRLSTVDLDFASVDYNGLAAPPTSPWTTDTVLQDYPANDTLSNIDNDLGFNRNSGGRNLFRGRTQSFVGLTYQIDNQSNGVALNQGLAVTFEYLNDLQVAGLLRAVSNKKHANFLVAPMVTCFNTQRANVAVLTQQAYIRDLTAVTQSGAGLFDPEIGYIQTGISLDVRPIVSHDRKYITMDLRPTVAELERIDLVTNSAGNISGAAQIELPVVAFRAIRTTASVPDRGSILVGGFSDGKEVEDYSGIPFISKIPVLNFLFGSQLRMKESLNDYILVKATIVSLTHYEEELFGLE
jgi:Flp pilus assembly secretin CpaC